MRKPSYCLIKQRGGAVIVTDGADKGWWHRHCYHEKSPNKTVGLGQNKPRAGMPTCPLMELVQKDATMVNQCHYLFPKKQNKKQNKTTTKKKTPEEEKGEEWWLNIHVKSMFNYLSYTNKYKQIDLTATVFEIRSLSQNFKWK